MEGARTKETLILVVEDYEPLQAAIQAMLEAEGWRVETASDGLEGLEIMASARPDLILADIMMPRMDGWAFCNAVRARKEWITIPFIFLTAKTRPEDILKGIQMGAEDYIVKPFEPETLVTMVRARLKRAEALRQGVEEELERLRQQIIAVPRQLMEAQESERRRIARELHDEIGQLLIGLKLILDKAGSRPASPEAVAAGLVQAQELVGELFARVREMSLELRPAMLDSLGLLPALLWYFERLAALKQVYVKFRHFGIEGKRFPPEIETTAFRIIQEALTNVIRHAQVNEATVRVWTIQNMLGLEVEDCGVGFEVAPVLLAPYSTGISGMRERVFLTGGQFTLESEPGEGTRIHVELPLNGRTYERRSYEHSGLAGR